MSVSATATLHQPPSYDPQSHSYITATIKNGRAVSSVASAVVEECPVKIAFHGLVGQDDMANEVLFRVDGVGMSSDSGAQQDKVQQARDWLEQRRDELDNVKVMAFRKRSKR